MKILIEELSVFYTENIRLVKNLMKRESPKEYPEQFKWALQMLYFDGSRWIEIARIDNYPHESSFGSHIHTHGRKEVKFTKLSFDEAETEIKSISLRILKEHFKEVVEFDQDEM